MTIFGVFRRECVNLASFDFFSLHQALGRLGYFSFLILIPALSMGCVTQVTLTWDASIGNNVAGYNVYYGTNSGVYQYVVDAGNATTYTISGLGDETTYFFAVTAYDGQQNESGYSNEVSFYNRPIILDVPSGFWAEDAIYRIYEAGITSGCSRNPALYCPQEAVSRAEMAVFLERAISASSFIPPTAIGIFDDVPTGYWAADWIEQLYEDDITSGCSSDPLQYCPDAVVTRAAMAIFLLRAEYDIDYISQPARGSFDDVPATHWAAKWIERLYEEGITAGCNTNPPLYCPDRPVSRAEMAVFLVRAFGL